MAYRLQIVENDQVKVSMNVRYENLAKYKKPPVIAKAPDGTVVSEKTTYQGQVLGPGSTQRQWCDDKGNVYSKQQLTFEYEGEAVPENTQTKVLTIEGYQPEKNYTDNYVIDKYYEVYPDDNGMKKDYDKKVAINSNVHAMRKLWDYLKTNQLVARGEFIPSSRGFVASDGYIRAIGFNNDHLWGLEIGVFKEEKLFEHLQEGIPQKVAMPSGKTTKRIKMV